MYDSIKLTQGHQKSNEYHEKGYPEALQYPIGGDKNIKHPVAKDGFQLIPKKVRTELPKIKSPEVKLEVKELEVQKVKSDQIKVLLITAHRSGSTFLGRFQK